MFADNPLLGEFSAFDEVLAKYLQTHGTDDLKVDGRITPIE
jgi:hypothetical protein